MIPEIIEKFLEDEMISTHQYETLSPLKKDYNKKFGNFLVEGEFLARTELETFFEDNRDFLFHQLDKWLDDNSKIADAIVWHSGNSKKNSRSVSGAYNTWPQHRKQELSDTFSKMLFDISHGLEEAPECTITLSEDGTVYSTDLQPHEAWNYYVNYVAHSLRVEIDRLVYWSITRYDQKRLEYFLDSRTFFEYIQTNDVYSILRWDETLFNHGSSTLGDPIRTYDFLDKEKLISITRWGTVGRFLGWCRDKLYHFEGDSTPENFKKIWQYEGYPPVERIISGTEHPESGFQHFTAGCWCTTGFMRTVLRTINIPVLLESRCGHAMPHFAYDKTHEFYLSHGDDPYNKLYRHSTPKFIPLELIINRYKFDEWFNKKLPEETICENIGRHALELAVEYIPDEILKIYCDDVSHGKTPEEGRLYNEIFRNHIELYELKALGLWDRLENRVESLGGCEQIIKEE